MPTVRIASIMSPFLAAAGFASHSPPAPACVPPWPTPVHLSGVIGIEQRLGPPGYGETPSRDEQITIFVLYLARPVDVCADTTAADRRPAVHGVRVMQLTGKADPDRLERWAGLPVSVFGTLDRETWGHGFTEVLVRVDSIPSLRRVPPRQRTV